MISYMCDKNFSSPDLQKVSSKLKTIYPPLLWDILYMYVCICGAGIMYQIEEKESSK